MVIERDFTKTAKRLQAITARTRSEVIQSALTLVATMCSIARTELTYEDVQGVAAALQKARRIEALIRQHLHESPDIVDVELRARLQKVQNQVAELERTLESRRRSSQR
jgi:uncharacterized protein (DUF2267 family)